MTGSSEAKKKSIASPKNAKTALVGGPEGQTSDSVFDFLYHDARRVGSFLAQFDNAGHLQQIVQGDTVAKSKKGGFKVGLTGGMGDATGLPSGGISFESNPADAGAMSSQRTYDPLWANAREFLDAASGAGLIERDLTKAGMGQLVLVSGRLSVIDLKMLKQAWAIPSIRKIIAGSSQEDTPGLSRVQRAEAKREHEKSIGFLMDLLPIMPHVVQASLSAAGYNVWASLDDNCLVTSAPEIVLQHGAVLKGEWNMIGILDAAPDDPEPVTVGPGLTMEAIQTLNAFGTTAIGNAAAVLGPAVRTLMGRPAGHYGVTPILLFREVSAG